MNTRTALSVVAAVVTSLGFSAAHAITVNLDATQGTGTFGSEIYAAPVTLSLAAGTYSLSVIDNTAAGGYNGWNYNTGPTIREAFTMSTNGGPTYSVDVGSTPYAGFSSAAAGIAAFATGPYYFYNYDTSGGGGAGGSGATFAMTSPTLNFTLGAPGTVTFGIPDNLFVDNTGGVSLSISAVPEPETLALMLGGLGMVGTIARRRQRV